MPRRALALLLALAPLAGLAGCAPTTLVCVAPAAIVGGQARIPLAVAQAGSTEPLSREVAVAKGDVFLADAAGRALPGLTVQTSASGGYQLDRVPPGQATMVAVRARTASGTSVTLKGLARVGTQGATADVNVATTIATTALLEGQREAIGDFDQAAYDKLVAKVYGKLDGVTKLDLDDAEAMIALFKGWMAQDAEMKALYDLLRAQVTKPKLSLADQLKALNQAQGLPTGGQLPPRPATPTPSGAQPSPTAAPSVEPSPSATPTPAASTSPSVLAGDVTTVAGQLEGFADGTGIQARFRDPAGIAFDPAAAAPTLYVADAGNHRIRRIDLTDPDQPVVTTIAGTGAAGGRDGAGAAATFAGPTGLAFDVNGDLLVTEAAGQRLRKIDVDDGAFTVSTVLAESAATALVAPAGVAVDPTSGAIYVADAASVVRIVDGAGNLATTPGDAASGAPIVSRLVAPAAGALEDPVGIAVDPNGFLWVADRSTGLVHTVAADGTVATFAGRADAPGYVEGQGTDAVFDAPLGLTRHPTGYLLVADAGNQRIRAIDPVGRTALVAGDGTAGTRDGRGTGASFRDPAWIAIAPDGSVYVADAGNHRIRRIN